MTLSKRFFAEDTDLTVWVSIATDNTGLNKIATFFNKDRNKTTEERITVPYINGILHGRDLGYANGQVSSKVLSILIALKDWALAIKEDEKGIDKEYVPPIILLAYFNLVYFPYQ